MSVARNSFLRLAAGLKLRIVRRVATKPARFRLAVASGFVIVAAGLLVGAADMHAGNADSIFGAMDLSNFFGARPQPAYEAAGTPSPQYWTPRHRHARVASEGRAAHHLHLARDAAPRGEQPMSLAGKSLCVRLCDGFAFPVGDYRGTGDRAAHEATCQSECPGARTALFVMPAGADSIGDATEIGSGRNYSEMPDAFHYTTYVDEACTCHPQAGNRIKSLLHDFTLRRGDSVMTSKGLQVFHGGSSFPFKRRDFVALDRSRDVRKGDRANLKAIERASLTRPDATTIAEQPATASPVAAAAPRDATGGLEHQARN